MYCMCDKNTFTLVYYLKLINEIDKALNIIK